MNLNIKISSFFLISAILFSLFINCSDNPVSTENFEELPTVPFPNNFRNLSWSPDGSKISFISSPGRIHMLDLESQNLVFLAQGSEFDRPVEWSPDGTKIAFTSEKGSFDNDISVININDLNLKHLTTSTAFEYDPEWSPDGSQIVYLRTPHVSVMNSDGTNQRNITKGGLANRLWPTWSSDGTKIAYISDIDGNNMQVYIINVDGSGNNRLTDDFNWVFDPTFSPDGKKILYSSETGISVIEIDGTNHINLFEGGIFSNNGLNWSPDGSKILFSSSISGNPDVYIVNNDGTGLQNLTIDSDNFDFGAVWSPDGTKIAFLSNSNGTVLYMMNSDGSNLTQISGN